MKLKKMETKTEVEVEDIERKLRGRLKYMAYVFFTLSLASLLFAFFVQPQERAHAVPLQREEHSILFDIETISGAALFSDMEYLELSPQDILNFYVVSLVFASIGFSLFHFSSKNSAAGSKMRLEAEENETP